jgi:type II secretory pathway pseudopilin PulG
MLKQFFQQNNVLFNKQGFSLMCILILLFVTGIALAEASKYWSTVIRREKEKELLFRGNQIKCAIEFYCKNTPSGRSSIYPRSLKDLLKDPRSFAIRRHLRKIYKDPMTKDGKWGLIKDSTGNIKGVFSKSIEKPIKAGNFPNEYKEFEETKKYSDWKFIYTEKSSKKNVS